MVFDWASCERREIKRDREHAQRLVTKEREEFYLFQKTKKQKERIEQTQTNVKKRQLQISFLFFMSLIYANRKQIKKNNMYNKTTKNNNNNELFV
jgi:hypothetical protein